MKDGQYEGRAIKGSVQFGETNKGGHLQIAINMDLFEGTSQQSCGQMTTFLIFSEASAVYSYERLRALGWKGNGPDDIDKLDDIYTARVPVRVDTPPPYKDTDGTLKPSAQKLEIIAGGTVVLGKPLAPDSFKARLKALGGSSSSGSGSSSSAGGSAPPF